MKFTTSVLAALGATAALALAGPASAAVHVFAMTGGTVQPGAELSVPATPNVVVGDTYDYTFSDTSPTSALSQMQLALKTGSDVPISFALYSGSPGTGSLLMTSGTGSGPTFGYSFTPGNYYLQLTVPTGGGGGTITGGISTASVPEPATWAMLIAGFGMAGFALRRRKVALSVA